MIITNMKEQNNPQLDRPASREERQEGICRQLEKEGRVGVDTLAAVWEVQPITIRRDLDELAGRNLLIRTRGGAVRTERVCLEFGYAERMEVNLPQKRAIARRAASLVEPGQTVLLDTGTTTQLIARELAGRHGLQIVTNSLAVGHELRGAVGISVILLGGQARPGGIELVGPFTERMLSDLRADIAFLGADAVDLDKGFYAVDPGVARVEQLMIAASATAVVTATAEKLRRQAFVRYASFDEVTRWVTCGDLAETVPKNRRTKIEIVEVDEQ